MQPYSTRTLCLTLLTYTTLGLICQAESPHWVNPDAFPNTVVELMLRHATLHASATSTADMLESGKELAELANQLKTLTTAQQGSTVQALLSVIDADAKEVRLLSDVTYGFPTQRAEDVDTSLNLPLHSAVALTLTHDKAPPKWLALTIGSDIPSDVASTCRWNDKVLVEFRVESVQLRPEAVLAQPELARYASTPPPGSPTSKNKSGPWCVVTIGGLRFLHMATPDRLRQHRTWLWPGPGTLPHTLSGSLTGDIVETSRFRDYASLLPVRGSAVFEVMEAHKDVPYIVVNCHPLMGPRQRSAIGFRGPDSFIMPLGDERLAVPKTAFTKEQRQALVQASFAGTPESLEGLGHHILLHFAAISIPGSANEHWDRKPFQFHSFRVGTNEELQVAEKELTQLADMEAAYFQDIAGEKDERLAQVAQGIDITQPVTVPTVTDEPSATPPSNNRHLIAAAVLGGVSVLLLAMVALLR